MYIGGNLHSILSNKRKERFEKSTKRFKLCSRIICLTRRDRESVTELRHRGVRGCDTRCSFNTLYTGEQQGQENNQSTHLTWE